MNIWKKQLLFGGRETGAREEMLELNLVSKEGLSASVWPTQELLGCLRGREGPLGPRTQRGALER